MTSSPTHWWFALDNTVAMNAGRSRRSALLRVAVTLVMPLAASAAAEPGTASETASSGSNASSVSRAPRVVREKPAGVPRNRPPNVLMIVSDDLNDWVGCLGGHPQASTPNLDALARRGVLFRSAHCQAPLCNPSRASALTGLRPSTTGIHGLAPGIRGVAATKDRITLPETFTRAGWHTGCFGKVHHDGSIGPRDRAREFKVWGGAPSTARPAHPIAKLPEPRHPAMDWGPLDVPDHECGDAKIADLARNFLAEAPADRPFLLAVGFRLPHVPCFAPKEWFDRLPAKVAPAPWRAGDRDDTPAASWFLHWKLPEPRRSTLVDREELAPLVRAYLASTSFMDHQLGRVLEALGERSGNTIVVFWSDHGYHLGEKDITGKNSLWERSTRVPLVIAAPGVRPGVCDEPTELLDLYPTLLELTGLPPRAGLEGISLKPWLERPDTPRARPAITTHNRGNHAVRDRRHRYIRYADGSEELFDLATDPQEWTNRAADPALADVKRSLADALPKVDVPAAPGSAHRILERDSKTGDWTWEGAPIRIGSGPIQPPGP
jgi:arylsulfatase A-like enzyme